MAALASGHLCGCDNRYPRRYVAELTGLPLRIYSAHVHMMEHLGGYTLMVALLVVGTRAAGGVAADSDEGVVVGLLGLHVVLKVFV